MLYRGATIVIIGCILWARHRDGKRSPVVLGLMVWLVAILLGPLLFNYTVAYSVKADIYVSVAMLAITAGYLRARKPTIAPPAVNDRRHSDVVLAHILGFLGVLGCLLLLANARASGTPLSFSYLLNNLGSLRQSQFDDLANSAAQSGLQIIGTYLASCALLSVVASIAIGRAGLLRILGAINFLLMAAVSLIVYAGRSTLFNLALLALVSMYLLKRRMLPRTPKATAIAVLALVGVWYFAVPYLTTREGEKTDPIAVLAETQRASIRPSMAVTAHDNPALGFAFVSIGYFTSPVATLSFYIQQGPPPGPLWGGYSYPLPSRTFAKLEGTSTPDLWLQNREKVFLPLEQAGYFPNVWSTWLRDLLADFGYVGAVLFSAIFGVVMGWARNAHQRTGHLLGHFFEGLACLTFAFGAFQNLLWNGFLSDAFFLCVLIGVAQVIGVSSWFRPRDDRIRPGRNPPLTFASSR